MLQVPHLTELHLNLSSRAEGPSVARLINLSGVANSCFFVEG